MTIKKIALIALAVIVVIGFIAGALYQRKVLRAELTQAVLIERAARLRDFEALQKKYDLLGELSTIKILEKQKLADDAMAAAAAIKVKSAAEIKAIKNGAGNLQTKYDTLEIEAVKLTDKVTGLESVIITKDGVITELQARDLVRVENITVLTGKLNECQTLLDLSIKNTASILKRGWILKFFDRVKFGPSAMIGSDGKPHFGIGAVLAVN